MSNKNRATDTFRLTVQTVPDRFDERHTAIQIETMDGILSVEPEAVCPVCGDPFVEAGRVGYNHPIDLEGVERACLGDKEEFSEGVGGLTWFYSHE